MCLMNEIKSNEMQQGSPDGDEQDHEEGEHHLHVGQRVHPKRTQDEELDHLQPREVVHLPLGNPADVVGGRIRRLDRDEGKQ